MRVLAIDYGERRLGLAVSDEAGALAFPAGTLVRRGKARDLAALRELAAERGVARVVVGLPLHMGGRAGPEARAALAFAAALRELAAERGIARVVVGLPLHMGGRAGPEARAALAFAAALGEATGLPVETLDERWTTREAERSLREQGMVGRRGHRRREVVDSVAATLLLQTFLARARAAQPAAGGTGAP